MASRSPLSEVQALVGGGASGSVLNTQLTTITQQLQLLQGINQTQIATMQANTQAVAQNTGTKSGGSVQSTASTIQSTFGFGLGLSPLISGLVSLFGGGSSSSTPAPLVPFVAPPPIHLTAGITAASSGPVAVDTGAGGLPRTVPSTSSSTNITVSVQAMDSRSFLDHSDDIAMAVRQAMLQSTTLNDVIRDI